jgi:hypothetical protein
MASVIALAGEDLDAPWADLAKQCQAWGLNSAVDFAKTAEKWDVNDHGTQDNIVHLYNRVCPSYLASANTGWGRPLS